MAFKSLNDITEHKLYQKHLLAALADSEGRPAAFQYFEGFAFDKETGPMLLVGKVDASLVRQVKESGAKAAGEGECAKAGKQLLILNSSTAKADKVAKALRIAKIALEPEMVASFDSTPTQDAAKMFDKAALDKLAHELKALEPGLAAIRTSEFADPDDVEAVAKGVEAVEAAHKAGKADAGEARLAELARLVRAALTAIAKTKETEEQRKQILASDWHPLKGRTVEILKSSHVDSAALGKLGQEIQQGYVAKRGDVKVLKDKLVAFGKLLGELEARHALEVERAELARRWKPLVARMSDLVKDEHADANLVAALKLQGKALLAHVQSKGDVDKPAEKLDAFEAVLEQAERALSDWYVEDAKKQSGESASKKSLAQRKEAESRKAKKEEGEDEAEEEAPTRPVYTVVGTLPATEIASTDAAYRKAQGVFDAMSAGDDPNTAAQKAGISEAPSKIETDPGKRWAYEFRLSHGQTQYRLNAVATSSDKGRNIAVRFAYLGRGH